MSEIIIPRERNIETVRVYIPSEDGKLGLFLLRRDGAKKNGGLWEAAGGQREYDYVNGVYKESLEGCAIREAYEETGLIVRIGSLSVLASRKVNDADMLGDYRASGCEGYVVGGEFKLSDDGEHVDAAWFDPMNLPPLEFTTVTTILIGRHNTSTLGL